MRLLRNYDIAIRTVAYAILFSEILQRMGHSPRTLFLCMAGLVLLIINDLYRRSGRFTMRQVRLSLLLSAVLAAVGGFYLEAMTMYLFILPWDVIGFTGGSFSLRLNSVLAVEYFGIWAYHNTNWTAILTSTYWVNEWDSMMLVLVAFGANMGFGWNLFYHIRERHKVQRLNEQLSAANEQLQSYADEIENLAIIRERNRLAQEMHDSLGHSLTGLIMHLDVIEKLAEQNPRRVRELAVKAQKMARQGMKEVREAVKTLREAEEPARLRRSLEEMIANLRVDNGPAIRLEMPLEAEELSSEYQHLCYKNVQEALTNAIKYSGSRNIQIRITCGGDELVCTITDDGAGTDEVVPGNGLLGMRERTVSHGGRMDWSSQKGEGFTVSFAFPRQGVMRDDKD